MGDFRRAVIDIPATKARLSDPREVARLLGLWIEAPTRNGVLCRCPAHNNKSGSLWLRYKDGKLRMSCFGCGIYGDVIDLLVAMEGDYRAGLARAEQLAGGSSGKVYVPEPEVPRIDPEVYHELAERILEAGRLDGREWVREVEEYLAGRRLLELARADGWACLPGLKWLLQIAEEVCGGTNNAIGQSNDLAGYNGHFQNEARDRRSTSSFCRGSKAEQSALVANGRGLTPHDLLIAADLAQYNKRGEFVPTWGRWRLVIPWRAPGGRITSLQRRRTWEHDGNGPEPAKYVFPRGIRPEWPYGSDRLCIGLDRKEIGYGVSSSGDKKGSFLRHELETVQQIQNELLASPIPNGFGFARLHAPHRCQPIAIVEGAVDTLAMRALHPTFTALGLPGIGGWRSGWARLVEGADLRMCLDRGKPDPHGVIPEDRTSARIALDCAGMGQETDHVLEWLISRHRRGRALFCVLCGRGEAWLCRGCGRRRAPEGMDWAGLWAATTLRRGH